MISNHVETGNPPKCFFFSLIEIAIAEEACTDLGFQRTPFVAMMRLNVKIKL